MLTKKERQAEAISISRSVIKSIHHEQSPPRKRREYSRCGEQREKEIVYEGRSCKGKEDHEEAATEGKLYEAEKVEGKARSKGKSVSFLRVCDLVMVYLHVCGIQFEGT